MTGNDAPTDQWTTAASDTSAARTHGPVWTGRRWARPAAAAAGLVVISGLGGFAVGHATSGGDDLTPTSFQEGGAPGGAGPGARPGSGTGGQQSEGHGPPTGAQGGGDEPQSGEGTTGDSTT
ncbi:hypothetical protein GCM10011519_31970 [Marmoricola endophyticus]|uniref:Uncharacterized protein n=1 Tax=Marmoricola endophyticus TaxID=2040280 RepID=A0A917BR64_9ACTN|nr:hypothetical protein [Marmoricola endophyticus]GGF55663.1 hypothetical protein GCM10011519_31970 [Marmoricola endophyticus]